jgi:hypothetical protein
MRHCATSWKVVGSIPGYVTEFIHWNNPSVRTFAMRLAYPLKEMSKGGRCLVLTLPTSYADCPEILKPKPPETLRAFYLIKTQS